MSDLPETKLQSRTKKELPGIQLRKAREARGLARKDIADRLHLSESVIDALEKDNYDHLPAPTFVRGYLRIFAALVNLNADSVIEQYNQYTGEIESSQAGKDNLHKEVSEKDPGNSKNVKIGAYLVLIFAVVIGITYLAGSEPESELEPDPELKTMDFRNEKNSGMGAGQVSENSSEENTEEDIDNRIDQKLAEAVELNDSHNTLVERPGANGHESGNLEKLQDQSLVDEEVDEVIEKSVQFADTDTGSDNKSEQQLGIADEETVVSSDNVFDVFQEDDEDILPEEKPVSEKSTPHTEIDKLSLEFHADAWIEIHDANGDRLLYRLGKEGRTYRVTGKAPFEVLLGNAKEVTVMLNGQVFDQTPYIRGQVARFLAGSAVAGSTPDAE